MTGLLSATGALAFHWAQINQQRLTSEEQRVIRVRGRDRLTWAIKSEHRAHHIWDCKVYSVFVAEVAGVRLLQKARKTTAGTVRRRRKRPTERFLDNLPQLR